MALGVLLCPWVLEAQHLPLFPSCQGGRANQGLPCLLWHLEHQGSLLGLDGPPASLFLLFLQLDQESHRVLGYLLHPLVQEVLGILEDLEGLLFLVGLGNL